MREKIESVFNALQELDIKPTPNNVSILSGVFDVLREVYQGVDNNAVDTCGSDNH